MNDPSLQSSGNFYKLIEKVNAIQGFISQLDIVSPRYVEENQVFKANGYYLCGASTSISYQWSIDEIIGWSATGPILQLANFPGGPGKYTLRLNAGLLGTASFLYATYVETKEKRVVVDVIRTVVLQMDEKLASFP